MPTVKARANGVLTVPCVYSSVKPPAKKHTYEWLTETKVNMFGVAGVGLGVQGGRYRLHHSHGHLDPALRHPDGVHRLLHRHHAVLHMALLLPPETEKRHPRSKYNSVWLLRHLPRHPFLRNRRLRLWNCSHKSLPNRLAFLSYTTIVTLLVV